MIIRPYRNADLNSVADLFTASIHGVAADHYDPIQRAAWAPEPPNLEAWRRRLAPRQTLVAEENSQLAGFISYEENGHIEFLYTAPTYTRRGVATMLYQRVELRLRSLKVEELFTEASLTARPFFERQGFHVTEEQTVLRQGISFQRYAMRNRIMNLQEDTAP